MRLSELILERGGSVDPSKYPDERFDLFSVPAYDTGVPEKPKGADIGSPKKCVVPGDVLLSRIVPHIRRCWIVPRASGNRQIASGEWIVFRTEDIDLGYLRHYLLSDRFHRQYMRTISGVGGSLLRARPAHVGMIEMPLPTAGEQKRIAAILDRAYAIRRKRQQAIALTRDLLASAFVERFGDPVLNPKGWEVVDLGSVLVFLTSGSRGWAKYYSKSGRKFVRIQNVGRNELLMDDLAYVSPADDSEARRTRVEPGDVLLSITADLGRTAVVPEGFGPAHVNQHLAVLRTRGIEPIYLSQFLASTGGQRQFDRLDRTGVKSGLNFDDIRSLRIVLPPVEEQRRYVAFWRKCQVLLARQEEGLLSKTDLFGALAQRAFEGEF